MIKDALHKLYRYENRKTYGNCNTFVKISGGYSIKNQEKTWHKTRTKNAGVPLPE